MTNNDETGKKSYILYFEGQIEVEADTDSEAIASLWELASIKDVGYYRIAESDPNSTREIRIVEEGW